MSVKLKTIVASQLPEFIRSDYPLFKEFVEAYYEYLDQFERRDLEAIRDIDETLEDFIKHFKRELDILGENYENVDPRFFLRKSKELFTAKGTEASYKLLFRLLYDKLAEVYYPWDQVIKASDGKWQQEVSLFVDIKSGDVNDTIGNYVIIQGPNKKIRVFVTRINNIGNGVYEVFINKDYQGEILLTDKFEFPQKVVTFDSIRSVFLNTDTIRAYGHDLQTGDEVVYSFLYGREVSGIGNNGTYYVIKVDNDHIRLAYSLHDAMHNNYIDLTSYGIGQNHKLTKSVLGTLLPTTSSYVIEKKGSGYRVGDLLISKTISNDKIIDQLIKVTRVDSNGGIIAINTVRFGFDYTADFFFLHANAASSILQTAASRLSITKNSVLQYDIPNNSIIERYADYGYVIKPDWAELNYTSYNYSGQILRQFYEEVDTNFGPEADFALIRFNIGPVAKYPGHYVSNDGFLDDDIYLQDSYRWQKFSYVIKVNEKLDKYKALVKSYLHPAGTELFGEYEIALSFDLNIGEKSTLQLGEWASKATISRINKSISNMFVFPEDLGGRIRVEPYDISYVDVSGSYNPPLSYSFRGTGNLTDSVSITDEITDIEET